MTPPKKLPPATETRVEIRDGKEYTVTVLKSRTTFKKKPRAWSRTFHGNSGGSD